MPVVAFRRATGSSLGLMELVFHPKLRFQIDFCTQVVHNINLFGRLSLKKKDNALTLIRSTEEKRIAVPQSSEDDISSLISSDPCPTLCKVSPINLTGYTSSDSTHNLEPHFLSRETTNSRNNFTRSTLLPLRDKSSKPEELKARTAT